MCLNLKPMKLIITPSVSAPVCLFILSLVLSIHPPSPLNTYYFGRLGHMPTREHLPPAAITHMCFQARLRILGASTTRALHLHRARIFCLTAMEATTGALPPFAYNFDSDGGHIGDQFMRNIEQVASSAPHMVTHGNHEDSAANVAHCIERFRSMPVSGLPATFSAEAGSGAAITGCRAAEPPVTCAGASSRAPP